MSDANEHHGEHGEHGHDPYLAHHFQSRSQQTASAKVGMWAFLATEVLMFGGLFCAYAVYRGKYPEMFEHGAMLLETKWGLINTVILIASSFTMAWGVRAAQLSQKKLLVVLLGITLLGGAGFMAIKSIEYYSKYTHGVLPGPLWDDAKVAKYAQKKYDKAVKSGYIKADSRYGKVKTEGEVKEVVTAAVVEEAPAVLVPGTDLVDAKNATTSLNTSLLEGGDGNKLPKPHYVMTYQDFHESKLFVNIYFGITGLHGLHVLIGMGLIGWLFVKALKGHFHSETYLPVDLIGLYWHIVDLIWIYLFPLLYLIGLEIY